MIVSLVAAVAENGVIGRDGGLPWRLSTDMKRFKAYTMGKPVIMGRKTWESFPRKPLPGRLNIVVTRSESYEAAEARVVSSLVEAIAVAQAAGADEICVIGGGEIYAQAIERADRLVITHVLTQVDGDTRFPDIAPAVWQAVSSEDVPSGETDSDPTRHVVYERRN